MFERFTEAAREVVLHGRLAAIELRHPTVGTEHLLLALMDDAGPAGQALRAATGKDGDWVRAEIERRVAPSQSIIDADDAAALRSIGIDPEAVLARIEESFGPEAVLRPRAARRGWFGRRTTPGGRFGPRAKKVLELALREALRLKAREIGTGCILLGLLREGEGLGMQILVAAGADPAALRADLEARLRPAA